MFVNITIYKIMFVNITIKNQNKILEEILIEDEE